MGISVVPHTGTGKRQCGVRACVGVREWCVQVSEWRVKVSGRYVQVSEWLREGQRVVHIEVRVISE